MFRDDMALGDARDVLRQLVDDGARCPCCTQFAKVYRRKLTSSMVRTMIRMHAEADTEPVYLPDIRITGGSRDDAMPQYWGLIAELPERREDGGRAGWWQLTPLGKAFILQRLTVPMYALVYDGRCIGFRGQHVTVIDCLGERFDYDELMGR